MRAWGSGGVWSLRSLDSGPPLLEIERCSSVNGEPCRSLSMLTNYHVSSSTVRLGTRLVSDLVTVDANPKDHYIEWHSSISWLDPDGKPTPTDQWSRSDKRLATELAQEALKGVGMADLGQVVVTGRSLHVYKGLTAEEMTTTGLTF